jgi:hypothetical protein
MKRFIFTSLLAGAAAIGFSSLAFAQESCETTTNAQMQTQMQSEQAGGNTIVLSGDQAERFLDYINEDIGHHTDYWGDGVIVGRYPALGYDNIAIVDDGCVDESKTIRLDPQDTAGALNAANGGSY